MKVRVHVVPRKGVLDPQGRAVLGGLKGLGFGDVADVRVGRVVDIHLSGTPSEEQARARAVEMAKVLLANEVVEDFDVQVIG
jgi:phosphoribosylformylglycinamidine synthase